MHFVMAWDDLKYQLIHKRRRNTENKLSREIKGWLNEHMHDIEYFNNKCDHLYKVVDREIAFSRRATGL